MARKSKQNIETPPSTAPEQWGGIHAEHWQSNGGMGCTNPLHVLLHGYVSPELPHYFIEKFTQKERYCAGSFLGKRNYENSEAAAQARHGIGNDLKSTFYCANKEETQQPFSR